MAAKKSRWGMVIGFVLMAVLPAAAAPSLSDFMNQNLGQRQTSLRYFTDYTWERDIKNTSGALSDWRQRVLLSAPLWQNSRNELTLDFNGGLIKLDANARLPKSGTLLPDELRSLELGLGYRHKFDNAWILGLSGAFGSYSDRLFANTDANTLNATAYLRLPQGKNSWIFLLNYDVNRDLWGGVPIPGAAYYYNPSPEFNLLLGFPFAVGQWHPAKRLTVSASYLAPTNIYTKIAYELTPEVSPYISYTWANQRYLLADRTDKDHRLFFYEMRAFAGVNLKLPWNLLLDFSGGYAFDRQIFQGEDYADRNQDRLEIENGWFVKADIRLDF